MAAILSQLQCVNVLSPVWRQAITYVSSSGVMVETQAFNAWLVKHQWAGSVPGWVSHDEYQVLGSTFFTARLDTLLYWAPFSWLINVGATQSTVIRLWWGRIGLAVLILHAAGVGLTGRPAVISGHYNEYHSLQLQNHQRRNPVLSGKESHWSLKGWIVKSAEHCGADYKPLEENQYWLLVNWTPSFKMWQTLNYTTVIFVQYKAFENIVYKMAAIISSSQFVNH